MFSKADRETGQPSLILLFELYPPVFQLRDRVTLVGTLKRPHAALRRLRRRPFRLRQIVFDRIDPARQFRAVLTRFPETEAGALAVLRDKDNSGAFERLPKRIAYGRWHVPLARFKFQDRDDVDIRDKGELPSRPIEEAAGTAALGG
jgi:hypothetical protein